MIARIFITLTLGILSAQAQRNLSDIPDPNPELEKAAFKLPEGMEIELYASDPMIRKPVQMNFDTQGRLWLVSSGMYPHIMPGAQENDRVIVLEDTDGDGKADKHTVFADDLHIPTAVMPADGGAYVANSTEILFLEDTDGDGKADKRKVLLSGFGTEDTHHLVHTFKQGPDGMLYFMQSIYIHSHVETPHGVRRLMGGGIWHFRPETHRAEILSKGLINPWGLVFDDYGQTFATDGAGGQGINFIFPRSVFPSSPGSKRSMNGLNPGQPKLCGLEILSGSHVPEKWQGVMISPDFRGHRINSYRLTPNESSYTSTRGEDFLSSSHRAFRPIDVKMGPDGALYIADWYNPIIQHGEVDFRDQRRDLKHGRIWRVTFKGHNLLEKNNFAKADIDELLKHLISKERIHRDLARTELRTRKTADVLLKLKAWSGGLSDDFSRLQALWAHQALNIAEPALIKALATSPDYRYRAAAMRVIYHQHDEFSGADEIIHKAIHDEHAQVRLWAISCLAQKPGPMSVPLALQALEHPVDETIDFALWSIVREHESHWVPPFEAGKNIFDGKMDRLIFAMKALGKSLNLTSVFAGLNDGSLDGEQKAQAIAVIAEIGSAKDLSKLLEFINEDTVTLNHLITAKKIRKLQPAEGQEKILPLLDSKQPGVFASAAQLAGQWQLAAAREKLITVLKTSPENRDAAAEGLRLYGGEQTIGLFEELSYEAEDETLRTLAVRELSTLAPAKAAAQAVAILSKDDGTDRYGLLTLFLKNPAASAALAEALKGKTLPSAVANLGVQRAETSGKPPKDLIAAFKAAGNLKPMTQQLTAAQMEVMVQRVKTQGDPHRGESVYRRASLACMQCHAIGGIGSPIGPDMLSIGTSAPIDYLITSLLDPNDKIKEGYHMTIVTEKNGNIQSGGLISEDKDKVVLRDNSGNIIQIARSDVQSLTISNTSMMPPGLTAGLREDEFVDLVRFLSELGKEGDFKTDPRPFIRSWKALASHTRSGQQIREHGSAAFAKPSEGDRWEEPFYSRVNGELRLNDLPDIKGMGNPIGVVRFGINSELKGSIELLINDSNGVQLFDGETAIKLPASGTAKVSVPAGGDDKRFTLVIDKGQRKEGISIETQTK